MWKQFLYNLAIIAIVVNGLPFKLTNHNRGGDNWAILIAGSDGWFNYRHQADISHAYQILRKTGFPANRIITFMKDDIAHNILNPTPGVIINRPGGPNVYEGVKIDYKGDDVTVENFIKVLLGQHIKGHDGKTLKSGPNDHVFINFVDHGGVGVIGFPGAQVMTSYMLRDTFRKMYEARRYKEIVFYMEACESGSMFEGLLPSHWSIFATTAARSNESSYATYYDAKRHTFLGDVYSICWMEDADAHFFTGKPSYHPITVEDEFLAVYNRTAKWSEPQQYGDISLAKKSTVEDFMAYRTFTDILHFDYTPIPKYVGQVTISARRATLYALTQMLQEDTIYNGQVSGELKTIVTAQQEAYDRFVYLADLVAGPKGHRLIDLPVQRVANHALLHDSIMAFHTICHPIDTYHLPYTGVLAHLTNQGFSLSSIRNAIGANPMCKS